jgi:hypothetical protein
MIYFSSVHRIILYGIYWGTAANSKVIFKIKKKIRAIMNSDNKDSCHELFKNWIYFFFILNTFSPYY